jgi:hypothetical protein
VKLTFFSNRIINDNASKAEMKEKAAAMAPSFAT